MKRLHTILTLLLAVALIALVFLRRNSDRGLEQELHALKDANAVLRQTLGDLTVSITQKDQQIDQLQSSCSAQQRESNTLHIPLPRPPKWPNRQPDRGSTGAN